LVTKLADIPGDSEWIYIRDFDERHELEYLDTPSKRERGNRKLLLVGIAGTFLRSRH
jgi:hypothetical protein